MKRFLRKFRSLLSQGPVPAYKINEGGAGIINFIDVGSTGGLPSPWDAHAGCIKFLLNFEPNDRPRAGKGWVTYNTAVWHKDEVRPFYIYKGFNSTGSSLFEQNYDYVREHWDELKSRGPQSLAETWFDRSELVETKDLRCRSLDNILRDEFPTKQFHFIKIDAQGAEMNILRGAEGILKSGCVGLHLELFVVPLYKGIALMNETVNYLGQFGFRLVKKYPAHGTFDSQHDCVFVHESKDESLSDLIKRIYSPGLCS